MQHVLVRVSKRGWQDCYLCCCHPHLPRRSRNLVAEATAASDEGTSLDTAHHLVYRVASLEHLRGTHSGDVGTGGRVAGVEPDAQMCVRSCLLGVSHVNTGVLCAGVGGRNVAERGALVARGGNRSDTNSGEALEQHLKLLNRFLFWLWAAICAHSGWVGVKLLPPQCSPQQQHTMDVQLRESTLGASTAYSTATRTVNW